MTTTTNAFMKAIGSILGTAVALSFANCTGTPTERAAKAAKAEEDLCKLRQAGRQVEEAFPESAPAAGSLRAKIEAAEDAFCAARPQPDSGAAGGGS